MILTDHTLVPGHDHFFFLGKTNSPETILLVN